MSEVELVDMLRSAEVSSDLGGLFGCELNTGSFGGNAWVDPRSATRSICGCQFENIIFDVRFKPTLRVGLALQSGERLNSLHVVDRDWCRFLECLLERPSESRITTNLGVFLNRSIRQEVMQAPHRFARIGLPRPSEGKCWLMLDSLFPQPKAAWLGGI